MKAELARLLPDNIRITCIGRATEDIMEWGWQRRQIA